MEDNNEQELHISELVSLSSRLFTGKSVDFEKAISQKFNLKKELNDEEKEFLYL